MEMKQLYLISRCRNIRMASLMHTKRKAGDFHILVGSIKRDSFQVIRKRYLTHGGYCRLGTGRGLDYLYCSIFLRQFSQEVFQHMKLWVVIRNTMFHRYLYQLISAC